MLRNRIRSNSGATILLALLFFLLCAMAGSIILSAGSAAAGRISGLKESEQAFYSVTSAAQVMRDEIEGQEFQAYTETREGGSPSTPVYEKQPEAVGMGKILNDAFEAIYKNGDKEVKDTLQIKPPSTYDSVMGTVTANFVMTDDYKIEITFSVGDSEKYICKLTAKAIVNISYSTREEQSGDQIITIEQEKIQVYWDECIIDKG